MKSRMFIVFSTVLLIASSVMSEVPKDLHGSWIINEQATRKFMKKSPKWKPEDEKQMPMVFKMLAQMSIAINSDTMSVMMRGAKESLKLTHISSSKGKHSFKIKDENGKDNKLVIHLTKSGKMVIRTDRGDDMAYFVWKKGKPSKGGPTEAEFIAEMMKAAVEDGMKEAFTPNTKTKPSSRKEKGPDADFKESWGGIRISRLNDESIAAIKAMDKSKTSKLIIDKTCSQESFDKIAEFTWVNDVEFAFGNENISSFKPLSALTGLTRFKTMSLKQSKDNPIDLKPLAGLTQMEDINLYGTKVTNIDDLSRLTKLKIINLYMTGVDSIDFLKHTPDVEDLNLYGFGHTFKDYQPVLNLKKLKKLNIYMNKQAVDEKVQVLEAITTLEEISMSHSKQLTTLSFLKGSKGMKVIRAAWCKKLTDISVLAEMKDLQRVNLSDNPVADFSALKGKTKLTDLDVSETSFNDLSILKESTNLSSLEIHKTPIKDLAYLANFKKLQRLRVSKDVPKEQIDELKKTHPKISVRQ